MNRAAILELYDAARALAEDREGPTLKYFERLRPEAVDQVDFLREVVFVIYCSGFREATLRAKWPEIVRALRGLHQTRRVLEDQIQVRRDLLRVFASKRKAEAAISAVRIVDRLGWPAIRREAIAGGPHYFERFPMVGPVTCYHVARNIGLDVVKPDRHLVRIASALGAASPLELCELCGLARGHRIGAVDFAWWVWAALTPGYLMVIDRTLAGKEG